MDLKDLQASLNLDTSHFWMPFTANRQFKAQPRLLSAAKDMHYTSYDGRQILDGVAGLWCVAAGHCRTPIVEAIQRQAATMDFAPTFQMGHPLAFEAATAVAEVMPQGLDRIFFVGSGSEAADTAMKMAVAYWRAKGQGTKTRIIGRERGYHGVNFGGMSAGGIPGNRKHFGPVMLGQTDHLRATHDLARNAFSKGQPEHGAEFADELERLIVLHDASNVAAVIVEPMAGSAGVLIPPKGYLERLRAICDKHGVLLIFDEVITGFGRTGAATGAAKFGVTPDIINLAKAINNASVPLGAVACKRDIHDTVVNTAPDGALEFLHGYTYSGHPLACAAVIATQKLFKDEGLFQRAAELAPYFEQAVHSLKGKANVIDVRNIGLVGAVELSSRDGQVGKRAYDVFTKCFWEKNVMVRVTGDTIALSPPLIVSKAQIDELVGAVGDAISAVQ
jgi:beta-alanine--pyruvate transaminase